MYHYYTHVYSSIAVLVQMAMSQHRLVMDVGIFSVDCIHNTNHAIAMARNKSRLLANTSARQRCSNDPQHLTTGPASTTTTPEKYLSSATRSRGVEWKLIHTFTVCVTAQRARPHHRSLQSASLVRTLVTRELWSPFAHTSKNPDHNKHHNYVWYRLNTIMEVGREVHLGREYPAPLCTLHRDVLIGCGLPGARAVLCISKMIAQTGRPNMCWMLH